MDFSRTSHLRNVMGVYLMHYDDSNKTEWLRQKLNSVRNVDSVALKKTFAAREYLFGDRRFDNMTKIFAQKLSVAGVLEDFELSNFYKTAKFIQAALEKFFWTNTPPAAQFKILDELDAEFDTYANIFPTAADALIQTVARIGFYKKECVEIFYRRLGDPRFGDRRFNWNGVSQNSRDIFSHWLSEEDLEIFFELVRATALDKQWKYREKFWRAYLPYIVKTRIFLEWSHNGKLRVHAIEATFNLFDTAEDFFDRNFISRNVLVDNLIAEWIHSSPKTYFWQGQVSDWLRENYGIDKTINNWGLEN